MIGILGGTFNPVHNGHLYLAERLIKELDLDEIRFVPSFSPPHKSNYLASPQDRLAMVQLAIQNHAGFKLDEREIVRGGTSYTIDTLQSLRIDLGMKSSLCWILGSDAFQHLDSWHCWRDLLEYCHLLIVNRPNNPFLGTLSSELRRMKDRHLASSLDQLKSSPSGFIGQLEIDALDISSTEIRNAIKANRTTDGWLPPNIIDYIKTRNLYSS